MATIHLHRKHQLGLVKARATAWQWAEEVERDLAMECTVEEGEDGDTVYFTRSGVNGTLAVAADHFELNAKLGLLVGAFAKQIEAQIEKQLDQLLNGAAPKAGAANKVAAKTGAKAASKPAAGKKAR